MNDILSPLDAPPPRYLMESDSSDEEGGGQYPGSSSRLKQPTRARNVAVTCNGGGEYENAVVGVGQAGRYLSGLGGLAREEAVEVLEDGKTIGRGWGYEAGILIDVEDGDVGTGWKVASTLLKEVKAKKWYAVLREDLDNAYETPSGLSSQRIYRLSISPILLRKRKEAPLRFVIWI
jgi:hypothetical protein